jgi:hypothetical protein
LATKIDAQLAVVVAAEMAKMTRMNSENLAHHQLSIAYMHLLQLGLVMEGWKY